MNWYRLVLGLCVVVSFAGISEPVTKDCPNLSGNYPFLGKWEKFESSVPNGPVDAQPRFDSTVLSIYVREVIAPRIVVVKQNGNSETLDIDILGSGTDMQWKEYRPLLPARITLQCFDGRWLREVVSHGKGGFAATELRHRIYIGLNADGELLAEGEKLITTGLFFKNNVSQRWMAKFRKQTTEN